MQIFSINLITIADQNHRKCNLHVILIGSASHDQSSHDKSKVPGAKMRLVTKVGLFNFHVCSKSISNYSGIFVHPCRLSSMVNSRTF